MSASILIVDPSADNREVLCTVLRRRGLTIWEAEDANDGLELARQHHPAVILLDVEPDSSQSASAHDQLRAVANDDGSCLILLGAFRRPSGTAGEHLISKPYHFAPLIHTIEQLAARAA
jgi:CheY-like chemotaxis protein